MLSLRRRRKRCMLSIHQSFMNNILKPQRIDDHAWDVWTDQWQCACLLTCKNRSTFHLHERSSAVYGLWWTARSFHVHLHYFCRWSDCLEWTRKELRLPNRILLTQCFPNLYKSWTIWIHVMYGMYDIKLKYQVSIRGPATKSPRPSTGPRTIVWVALF